MYHIKSDRRSQRTAEEIGRGFLECLKEKPLSAVTVTDLYRATGISRATFYRLFDTVEDVLEYLCDQSPKEDALLPATQPGSTPGTLFVRILELGLENHDLLQALVDNGRFDLVHRYAEEQFRMLSRVYPGILPELGEAEYDYMISGLSMNMVSTLVTWVRRGRRETPEQIAGYTDTFFQTAMALIRNPHSFPVAGRPEPQQNTTP